MKRFSFLKKLLISISILFVSSSIFAGNSVFLTPANNPIPLGERSDDPLNQNNLGFLYSKDISGITELFYQNNNGNILQITSGSGLGLDTVPGILKVNRINSTDAVATSVTLQNQTFSPGADHEAVIISPTWTAENFSHIGLWITPTQNGANSSGLEGIVIDMTKATAATTLASMVGLTIGGPTVTGTVTASYGIDFEDQTNANITTPRGIRFQTAGVANSIVWGGSALQYANGAENIRFMDSTNARGLALTLTAAGNQEIATTAGSLILDVAGTDEVTITSTNVDVASNTLEMNNFIQWDTGVAVTAAQYQITRDADATNQLHFNVPTGATFEFSINDTAALTVAAAQINASAASNPTILQTSVAGGESRIGAYNSRLGILDNGFNDYISIVVAGINTNNNRATLPINIPVISGSATHTLSLQIDGNIFLSGAATGDGAGAVGARTITLGASGDTTNTAAAFRSTSATAGIGYGTGAGGTVTQLTDKATGVELNTVTGEITMNNAALASDTTVSFTLTNSAIAATDQVVIQHFSAGTAGAYLVTAQSAAGSATVNVRNITAGSLSEAIVLKFIVFKAVTS